MFFRDLKQDETKSHRYLGQLTCLIEGVESGQKPVAEYGIKLGVMSPKVGH